MKHLAEINNRYTEIVANLISQGYTISAGTMGGTQGELARIDLCNGESTLRVLVEDFQDETCEGYGGYQIVVGKAKNTRQIWNCQLEIISCEKYYSN